MTELASFIRFTDRARRCLNDAANISASRGDAYVGTEHIWIACLKAGGMATRLADIGAAEQAMKRLNDLIPPDPWRIIAAGLAGRPPEPSISGYPAVWDSSQFPLEPTIHTLTLECNE